MSLVTSLASVSYLMSCESLFPQAMSFSRSVRLSRNSGTVRRLSCRQPQLSTCSPWRPSSTLTWRTSRLVGHFLSAISCQPFSFCHFLSAIIATPSCLISWRDKVLPVRRGRCSNREIEKSVCSKLKMWQNNVYPWKILTCAPNQNLIIKLKNLGYLKFSTAAPKTCIGLAPFHFPSFCC